MASLPPGDGADAHVVDGSGFKSIADCGRIGKWASLTNKPAQYLKVPRGKGEIAPTVVGWDGEGVAGTKRKLRVCIIVVPNRNVDGLVFGLNRDNV